MFKDIGTLTVLFVYEWMNRQMKSAMFTYCKTVELKVK